MEKETVIFFLDYANINRRAREKRSHLDYDHLLQYVSEGRFLLDARCYVPINPRNEHRLDRAIEELWSSGYLVTSKIGTIAGGTYKCNFDVEITLDVLKVVYQIRPDIIVLATGDADFLPLILEARKSGVRVEVAAFAETVGAELLLKCSGFIDLAVYYDSYLAAGSSEPDEESLPEPFQDLIQSQNNEENLAKEYSDLIMQHIEQDEREEDQHLLQESDLDEDDGEIPADQGDHETEISPSPLPDELEL